MENTKGLEIEKGGKKMASSAASGGFQGGFRF